jgi:hypothetical protein
MAISINQAYVKQFQSNVRHLAQQKGSKLRSHVIEVQQTSSKTVWPRLSTQSFQTKAGARVATPENDSTWSNRVAVPVTKHGGDTVEVEDINQMLVDPTSNIATSLGMAAGRTIDDIIISALGGSAADESGSTTALPSGQKLGADAQAVDLALLLSVNKLFQKNDIDPDTRKIFLVSPKAVSQMLALSQLTSQDYAQVKYLATNGFVSNFAGFDFILSNRLPYAAGDNTRKLYAFTEDAIGLLVVKDIWAEVAKDPSYSFMWRVYSAFTMGAVRLEESKVVEIQVEDEA